jgi:hypothetical protein
MNREVHVRICEGLGVKFPGLLDPLIPNTLLRDFRRRSDDETVAKMGARRFVVGRTWATHRQG